MFSETEILNNFVARIFRIDDFTIGDPQKGYIVRYRGHLLSDDSAAAYDQLADAVKPYHITPLFRQEKDQQVIYLAASRPDPKPTRPIVNIILFILTVLSVMFAGIQNIDTMPSDLPGQISVIAKAMLGSWPYALSLMSILLAHEFGHYFMSRHHKVAATLPYFIPMPLPPLGTMGAAIMMQGVPKNKRVLFDIGVAGPLAGMALAIPILLYGLSISPLITIQPVNGIISQEGNSLLYVLAKFLIFGKLLPSPINLSGTPLALHWLRFFFTGQPIPIGGADVFISPIAFAGWAGLLVTALNLIPAGTLDGGHVIYALFGDNARKAFPYILGTLIVLGLFWSGWWLWAVILLWLGRVHAEPLDQITQLDAKRKWIAVLVIIIFILTFMPVPFTTLNV
jgi:membrane-associated protease RseP (regulator of RpoE activity)